MEVPSITFLHRQSTCFRCSVCALGIEKDVEDLALSLSSLRIPFFTIVPRRLNRTREYPFEIIETEVASRRHGTQGQFLSQAMALLKARTDLKRLVIWVDKYSLFLSCL